jgi:hypothetical protein
VEGYMLVVGVAVLVLGCGLANYFWTLNKYGRDWETFEVIVVARIRVRPFLIVGVPLALSGVITLLLGVFSSPYDVPSPWWWLVALYFGFIGGLVGFIKVKGESKRMAFGVLFGSILWSVAFVAIAYSCLDMVVVEYPV